MNYEMNTIELMAKTVWSDTTFITEVGKAAIDGSLENITLYFSGTRLCRLLGVITSINRYKVREFIWIIRVCGNILLIYGMDRAEDSLWYMRTEIPYIMVRYIVAADKRLMELIPQLFYREKYGLLCYR